jgi:hypothetical protein
MFHYVWLACLLFSSATTPAKKTKEDKNQSGKFLAFEKRKKRNKNYLIKRKSLLHNSRQK